MGSAAGRTSISPSAAVVVAGVPDINPVSRPTIKNYSSCVTSIYKGKRETLTILVLSSDDPAEKLQARNNMGQKQETGEALTRKLSGLIL
jgi:hypothetical protein